MKIKEAFEARLAKGEHDINRALWAYDNGSIGFTQLQYDVLKVHRDQLEAMFDWAFEIGLNTEVSDEQDGTVLEELDLDDMEGNDNDN